MLLKYRNLPSALACSRTPCIEKQMKGEDSSQVYRGLLSHLLALLDFPLVPSLLRRPKIKAKQLQMPFLPFGSQEVFAFLMKKMLFPDPSGLLPNHAIERKPVPDPRTQAEDEKPHFGAAE